MLDLAHAAPEAAPAAAARLRAGPGRSCPAHLAGHGYAPAGCRSCGRRSPTGSPPAGLPTEPDQVVVTAGVGDATAVVLETLLQPGDRVLVEHPTYPGVAASMVAAAGGRLHPRRRSTPAEPDALVRAAHLAARQSSPRLAFLMPDFSNPTGARLSAAGRRRLAATLWQQGVLTVVDEVAAELHLDGEPLPPYAAEPARRRDRHVGGLSKAVWGGLRIGWLRTDAALAAQLGDDARPPAALRRPARPARPRRSWSRRLDEVLEHRRAQLRERRDVLLAETRRRAARLAVPPRRRAASRCGAGSRPRISSAAGSPPRRPSTACCSPRGAPSGPGTPSTTTCGCPSPGRRRSCAAAVEVARAGAWRTCRSAPARDHTALRSVTVV